MRTETERIIIFNLSIPITVYYNLHRSVCPLNLCYEINCYLNANMKNCIMASYVTPFPVWSPRMTFVLRKSCTYRENLSSDVSQFMFYIIIILLGL